MSVESREDVVEEEDLGFGVDGSSEGDSSLDGERERADEEKTSRVSEARTNAISQGERRLTF